MNTLYITNTLLVLFFTFASSIKIFGWQKLIFDTQLQFFVKYGLNRSIMRLVGMVEMTASILLATAFTPIDSTYLVPVGAALIALTSIGAIFFHLRFDTFKDAIPAIVTLLLSSYVLISLQMP
ncbi:DoxX family protein [Vibrio sp. SCSIO 43135]|uniref:DoxX family protein n=1 Tax=Vibrio sp. SCSIO 43135 TaxID=2819096 RepID=UPI0020757EBD|nr:DoxX family protein [Vibrio sp. SCSIO 43135]USD43251.1 DoxX family protein [Vibrio sp. SCSIO 43135]